MELDDLYQDVILDHGRNPRHFYEIADATNTAEGFNPLCGDRYKIYVKLSANKIVDAAFTGQGCAISMAATSLLLERIIGKDIVYLAQLSDKYLSLLTEKENNSVADLGKLAVMQGVTKFPMRIKCATLGCHAIRKACGCEV
jgi:nitrogen fixation NifU-like protein